MRSFIWQLVGWIFNFLLWLWAAVPKALDWVGRSTLPDDWRQLMDERLPKWASWLFATPWWVPTLLAALLTCWLMYVTWPRPHKPIREVLADPPPAAIESAESVRHSAPIGAIDAATVQAEEETATELMIFFLDYIVPAVRSQHKLQLFMVRDAHTDNLLIGYALSGTKARSKAVEEFWRSFDYLDDAFCSSPPDHVALNEMIDHMAKIEVYYGYLCGQAEDIAAKTGINCSERYPSDWEEWRSAHSALKIAYDNEIKRSKRFGRLFRPGRDSRWDDVHMPVPVDI